MPTATWNIFHLFQSGFSSKLLHKLLFVFRLSVTQDKDLRLAALLTMKNGSCEGQ